MINSPEINSVSCWKSTGRDRFRSSYSYKFKDHGRVERIELLY
jgi:hypothetical protein